MSLVLGIGVGLPFGGAVQRLPPQAASLRFWGRSIDVSGADVAAWTGKAPGSVAFTAVGGERPDASATGLVFNGTDRMNALAGALDLGGATKATVAFWVKLSSAGAPANAFVFSSDSYPNGFALGNLGGTASARWLAFLNGGNRHGSDNFTQVFDAWQFFCASYDGAGATDNDKLRMYTLELGQTIPTELVLTTGTGLPAALAANSGNAAIGDLPALNRRPAMTLWDAYAYRGVALSSAEALELSRLSKPLDIPGVLAMGDSIVLGQGDAAANGGWRGDLLTLAGSYERWWYLGPLRLYAANAPNNRTAAAGGTTVAQHLAQFNDSVAAGWDPSIILYCGGQNDVSLGETALLPARYAALFAAWAGRRAIVHVVPPQNPTTANTAIANGYLAAAAAIHPNITVVDGGLVSPGDLFDTVHPNAGGYDKMANAIWTPFSAHV